ncbi:MAG: response regulator [Halobacteriaceae archaeon]
MSIEQPTVLLVEDERSLADLYAEWLELEGRYETRVAYGGTEAIDTLDEEIDVVLLDRRMPDMSGDEVLEEIKARELSCRVVMVTAVEPDFDVLEMGFDEYLVKPVQREDLVEAIDTMQALREYDEVVQRYYQLTSKKTSLEAAKRDSELAENEEYQALIEELDEVRSAADELLEEVDDEGFRSLF